VLKTNSRDSIIAAKAGADFSQLPSRFVLELTSRHRRNSSPATKHSDLHYPNSVPI